MYSFFLNVCKRIKLVRNFYGKWLEWNSESRFNDKSVRCWWIILLLQHPLWRIQAMSPFVGVPCSVSRWSKMSAREKLARSLLAAIRRFAVMVFPTAERTAVRSSATPDKMSRWRWNSILYLSRATSPALLAGAAGAPGKAGKGRGWGGFWASTRPRRRNCAGVRWTHRADRPPWG